MKKPFFLTLFLTVFFLSFSVSYAISEDDFALSIVHDQYPVREIDNRVAVPFDSEYRIRLKNGHDRKCTAKVFIDGAPVSKLGDFILDAGGEIDLERFLDSSLTKGKRFKFVQLSHPDVDDPAREENGIVRVEFRLEKIYQFLKLDDNHRITPNDDWSQHEYWWKYNDEDIQNNTTIQPMSNFTSDSSNVLCSNNSATELGATIAGSESKQTFHRSHVYTEDEIYTLELRIVGITQVSRLFLSGM